MTNDGHQTNFVQGIECALWHSATCRSRPRADSEAHLPKFGNLVPHTVLGGSVGLHASCLCGGIAFEIDGFVRDPLYCHCAICRKAHEQPFVLVAASERPMCAGYKVETCCGSTSRHPVSIEASVRSAGLTSTRSSMLDRRNWAWHWASWTMTQEVDPCATSL